MSTAKQEKSPILVAAKMGVTEMVEEILKKFPIAIEDMNQDKKNVVLLAVENRQPRVYTFLQKKYATNENIFQKLDNEGNSALHLAATLGNYQPWMIPGAALQMQWELKWFEVITSLPWVRALFKLIEIWQYFPYKPYANKAMMGWA